MNKAELARILIAERFRLDAYDLEGGTHDECYCLGVSYGSWSVYYSERGLQSGVKEFASEGEACEYLLQLLREDLSTREA